ncbi:MAG TPA: acyl-CoA dehydrogenase family protein [Acidimicrobiia bacterium]|jgi:alkylation response protein AidB-like acyl-CoA dehydrogenase|nr:acyl-CoA dehydrogenase family protein [Acidimicrobiia bacterium]
MHLGLTDDQQFFQETTRKFLEQAAPLTTVRALADDPAGFERAWWSRGAELGWTSFLVPEADGGGSLSGEGVVDLAIVAEEMGRLVSPGPLVPTNVVADAVARGGTPELQAEVLPAIVAGDVVAAWCIAGPRGGWDASGVAIEAVPDGDGMVLDGVSTPVEHAAQADELLVTARTTGGLTQCLVPASADGVVVDAIESVDLVRRFATVRFEGVPVSAARIVGEVGGAAAAVERQLHLTIVLQCAEVVGALDRVLDVTLEYLGDRSSFGRPLASYQAIKHRIADMKMWIEGCHGVTELAVQAVQDDDPDAVEIVSAAASYLGDHAGEILQECTQLHGGIGVTWEHDLHLYLRRITLDRNLFGTPAQHRERIAAAIISKHGPALDKKVAGD